MEETETAQGLTCNIPLLAAHLLEQTARRLELRLPRLTAMPLAQLQDYDWPCHVWELQNVIECAVILAKAARYRSINLWVASRHLQTLHLPPQVLGMHRPRFTTKSSASSAIAITSWPRSAHRKRGSKRVLYNGSFPHDRLKRYSR